MTVVSELPVAQPTRAGQGNAAVAPGNLPQREESVPVHARGRRHRHLPGRSNGQDPVEDGLRRQRHERWIRQSGL